MRGWQWVFWAVWAALAGCQTVAESLREKPEYGPAEGHDPAGYRVTELANGEYQVDFRGDRQLGLDQVEEYAFQRASELAVEKGKQGFDLLERVCGEEIVAWSVPEHQGGPVEPGDVSSPVRSTYIPGYTHEKKLLACRLRLRLLDSVQGLGN